MHEPVAKRRPNFNRTVRALLQDVSSRMEEFAHIKSSRILVVAGEARRASRATVKPLMFPGGRPTDEETGYRRPLVRIRGKKILYTITLRPLFFRESSPQARIGTILHELFHVSKAFDGTLSERRRHAAMGDGFVKELRPLVRRYLRECPAELKAQFAYHGEVRVAQWLERPGMFYIPGRDSSRRVYTEEQLFVGTLRMITRRSAARRLH